VCRAQSEGGDSEILLVDAAAVKLTLYTRLKLLSGAADGDMKAEDAAFLHEFYNTTAVYFQALLRTGLKVKTGSLPRCAGLCVVPPATLATRTPLRMRSDAGSHEPSRERRGGSTSAFFP